MSKVVKVALPIIGGIVGTFFGMPEVGYAIGGYLGGRSYGGGNEGGLYGAAGSVAGNALGSYFSGMGSAAGIGGETAAGSSSGLVGGSTFGTGSIGSPNYFDTGGFGGSFNGAQDLTFSQAGAGTGANVAGGSMGAVGDPGMGQFGQDVSAPNLASGTQPGDGTTSPGTGAASYNASPLQQLMQKLGMGPGGSPASPSGGSGLFGTGLSGRNLLSIGSGLYALQQAEALKKASDPFGQYRGQYGEQLAALERNPASITTRPGYQAGLQAVQRAGAAQGYNGSGNMAASLAKYGGDFYQQEAARLAYLAGGSQTPGAGQYAGAQLAGQGLASIGYGFAPQRDPNQGSLRYGQ